MRSMFEIIWNSGLMNKQPKRRFRQLSSIDLTLLQKSFCESGTIKFEPQTLEISIEENLQRTPSESKGIHAKLTFRSIKQQ